MDVTSLLHLLIVIIILGVCFGIFMKYILPQLPEGFRGIALVVAAVIAILLLLGLISYGPGLLPFYRR